MKLLTAGLALVIAATALPTMAAAWPHHGHPHCTWTMHHHHRVKVCR